MDLTLRRAAGGLAASGPAAESWFLRRGLPSVLTTRARWRRLWPRSAPMLAAYGTLQVCVLAVFSIVGGGDIEITDNPTPAEWVVLGIVALALPLMALVGWLVSRLRGTGSRTVAAGISVLIVACKALIVTGVSELLQEAIVIAAVLLLTGCGVGSVVAWAVRMTFEHLSTVGTLAIRALPIVLLTALVFFNTYVWLMAATINGRRLSLALAFLLAIAGAFVVSKTVERVRPMFKSTASLPEGSAGLADTPFATMPDPSPGLPLKKSERLNVVFLLATSQLVEIVVVALVGAAMYLILGLIILTPQLLNEWTHTYVSTATVLGWTLPVPDSLIHMCLFLGALTFMYISARAVDDAEYRGMFLDPLIQDLHVALTARNRYLGTVTTEGA
jgi:hypothetical protein